MAETSNKQNQNTNILMNLKSRSILELVIGLLKIKKSLKFLRFNKSLLNKLRKSINDYKEYLRTEIKIENIKNEKKKRNLIIISI